MKNLIMDDMARCEGDGGKGCETCARRLQIDIDAHIGQYPCWHMAVPARDGDKCPFETPVKQ